MGGSERDSLALIATMNVPMGKHDDGVRQDYVYSRGQLCYSS